MNKNTVLEDFLNFYERFQKACKIIATDMILKPAKTC